MPRINVDADYFDHPKAQRLRDYCGLEADVFPIRLWTYCAKYFPKDGVLKGYEKSTIEILLKWNGIPGNLATALERLNFIEKCDEGYKIHDWLIHAEHVFRYKEHGRKMAKKRWKSRTSLRRKSDACSIAIGNTIELNGIELNNNKEKEGTGPKNGPFVFNIPDDLKNDEDSIKAWLIYKKEKGQSYKARGLEALWKAFRAIPADRRRASVDHSMANNWSGLFEKTGSLPAKKDDFSAELAKRRKLDELSDSLINRGTTVDRE